MRRYRVTLAAAVLAAAFGGVSVAYAADAASDICLPPPGSSATVTHCVVSPITGECRCPDDLTTVGSTTPDPGPPKSVTN
jgi:hypothetical protein